ncbi:MAG TPA: hypothetical protein VJ617_10015 [Arthrobacter sp.]|nr:hypothetical protein [Arthrobacter sp.]
MSEQQTPGQEPTEPATPEALDPWAAFPAEFNWVRKELEDTRKEAAEKRVLAKDLQTKLADAKTPEEVKQLTAAYDTKTADLEAQLARERVARRVGLDEDLVEFLTAKTEQELLTQAAKLARKKEPEEPVVVTVQEPRGGLDPSTKPDEPNGFAEYERWKASRR